MVKPEWGAKRQCPSCGERFYDLNADPVTCPECGSVYEIEQLHRGKRARAVEPQAADEGGDLESEDEALVDDDADATDVIEDEEEDDASPKAGPEAAADTDDDDIEADEDLLVEDEDESDDDQLGDFGGDEDDRR